MLESRTLLSVSASALLGQTLTPGAKFVYSNAAATRTETATVLGPATAPTGQSAIEIDENVVETGGPSDPSTTDVKRYSALTPDGAVDYVTHQEYTNRYGSGVADETFVPPRLVLPATLSAGQTYQSSYVLTNVNGSDTTTSDDTRKISLASDTPQAVTVPAGTFSANEVMVIDTFAGDTGSSAITSLWYYAPDVGAVKVVTEIGTNPDLRGRGDHYAGRMANG